MRSPWRIVFACVGLLGLAVLSGRLSVVAAQGVDESKRSAREEAFPYEGYAAVLKARVDDEGMVNYRELKASRRRLDLFVGLLGDLDKEVYEEWTDEQKIAFWINAYNALTLRVIIDHYPIKKGGLLAGLRFPKNSIRQIPGVWDQIKFTVMGEKMTLEEIEHETLRKDFDEPRIHMALVCAAMGCPPLLNEPYVAVRLEEQFTGRAEKFFSNPKKFRIDRRRREVHLSPIFKWFGEDFEKTYGTDVGFRGHDKTERAVLSFIARYLDEDDARYLRTAEYDIEWLDYDWSLNEQPAKGRDN